MPLFGAASTGDGGGDRGKTGDGGGARAGFFFVKTL